MAPMRVPRSPLLGAHIGMGILFLTWLGFAIATGDARPAVLDVLLGSIGGVWFGLVAREQGKRDSAATDQRDRTEAKVDQLVDERDGGDA